MSMFSEPPQAHNNVFANCDTLFQAQFGPLNFTVLDDGGGGGLHSRAFAVDNLVAPGNGGEQEATSTLTFTTPGVPNATWSNVDWTLDAASSAAIKSGGLDGDTEDYPFLNDFAGAVRTGNGTTGWSMGAFEKD